MSRENEISTELQMLTDLKREYERSIKTLMNTRTDEVSVTSGIPSEVARLVSANSRGIKRVDKMIRALNKELSNTIEPGDTPYVHSED